MSGAAQNKVTIRLAGPEDAETVAHLGRSTFTETFGHLFRDPQDLQDYFDRTFKLQKIEASLRKENNVYWLAFAEGQAAGYAKLKLDSPSAFLNSGQICQLQKIYVLNTYLGMKIGYGLQNELLKKAAEHGCSDIWLSVLKENQRAIDFYKRGGYQIIGEHDFSIGKEDFRFLAMSKALS